MSLQTSEDGSLEGRGATPTVTEKTDGKDFILIPQPSDDPEDPLVRRRASQAGRT
jgi:hypothetical protein